MARTDQGTVTPGASRPATSAAPRRRIERRPSLPGSRAVVGALLMVVAAMVVFLAYADASDNDGEPVVVAEGPIRAGERITAADLRVERADLPGDGTATFRDPARLVGRVALAAIDEGELVQASAVTDQPGAGSNHEVALTLPRAQVAVGRLKVGERVDVFVTRDDRTASVVRGAVVVQLGLTGEGSLTSEREVGLVVAVESGQQVAALVHALRTGDVTVVRSTFSGQAGPTDALAFEPDAAADGWTASEADPISGDTGG